MWKLMLFLYCDIFLTRGDSEGFISFLFLVGMVWGSRDRWTSTDHRRTAIAENMERKRVKRFGRTERMWKKWLTDNQKIALLLTMKCSFVCSFDSICGWVVGRLAVNHNLERKAFAWYVTWCEDAKNGYRDEWEKNESGSLQVIECNRLPEDEGEGGGARGKGRYRGGASSLTQERRMWYLRFRVNQTKKKKTHIKM